MTDQAGELLSLEEREAIRKRSLSRDFDLLYGLVMSQQDSFVQQSQYSALLIDLRNDQKDPILDITYLGLERAPAAKRNHHACEGGLIDHLLEMWNIWLAWEPLISNAKKYSFFTSGSLSGRVLKAIINHDLEKAYRTFVLKSTSPWKVEYGPHRSSQLLNGDQKSLWLLNRAGIHPTLEEMNALFWSHGGFSLNPPKEHTVLAKLVYLIDEMSGNVLDRIRTDDHMGRDPKRTGGRL